MTAASTVGAAAHHRRRGPSAATPTTAAVAVHPSRATDAAAGATKTASPTGWGAQRGGGAQPAQTHRRRQARQPSHVIADGDSCRGSRRRRRQRCPDPGGPVTGGTFLTVRRTCSTTQVNLLSPTGLLTEVEPNAVPARAPHQMMGLLHKARATLFALTLPHVAPHWGRVGEAAAQAGMSR